MTKKKEGFNLTVKTNEGNLTLSFKEADKFILNQVIDLINKDNYGALEMLFDYLVIDKSFNKEDFATKMIFYPELREKVLSFVTPEVNKNDDGSFEIRVNKKVLALKNPDKIQFKELFNKNIESPTYALEYVLDTLYDGYEKLTNSEYFGLIQLPTMILFQKQLDLKKK